MYYGADYYPEHWPEERWHLDTKLMEEVEINVTRLAEFVWSKLEPEEGRFDFSWLDKVIDILSKHNIKVVLSTPTASPLMWLMKRYPFLYEELQAEGDLTVSIGIATFPNDAYERLQLIDCADNALYRAKGEGRNRMIKYSEELDKT
jgi:beta-galactosidase GanA